MINPRANLHADYPYIGHPTTIEVDRLMMRAFGDADQAIPSLAVHASQRALENFKGRAGPGPRRELLTFIVHPTLSDPEWEIVTDGVAQWGRSNFKRERGGIELLATRTIPPSVDHDLSVVTQGNFLIANCSDRSMQICAGSAEGSMPSNLAPAPMTPAELAERWTSDRKPADWIVVLLPAFPDQMEFTTDLWARHRRSLVKEFSERGGSENLKLALLPMPAL
jgi:hypothetical protein